MKFFINFISIIILVTSCHMVKTQNCISSNISFVAPNFPNQPITPKFIGDIFSFDVENANSAVISTDGWYHQYFSLSREANIVTISTTANFENYEIQENGINPGFVINFICGATNINMNSQIVFRIERVNNYDPEFTSAYYEITIPTPLPRGFDVTYFMDSKISAIDNDIYNNLLTFEIVDTNLLRVEFDVDASGLKPIHRVKLFSTQSILQLSNDQLNFALRATDTFEEGPRSRLTNIRILIDPSNSFDGSTGFMKSFYEGTLYENNTQLVVPDIILQPLYFTTNTTFVLSGHSGHFHLDVEENLVRIVIRPGSAIEDVLSNSFYLLHVEAFEHEIQIARTNVFIKVSNIIAPQFDKTFYTGILSNTGLNHERIIIITGNNLQVLLDDDALFNAVIELDSSLSISLRNNAVIPGDENFLTITMTLRDTVTNKQIDATLLIRIDLEYEEKLMFSRELYEGRITKNSEFFYDTITVSHDSFNVEIAGNHAEFFTANVFEYDVQLTPQNINQIPKNISYLHITVIASRAGFLNSSTIVIVGIERENGELEPSQPYFETGSYFIRVLSDEVGVIGMVEAKVGDESRLIYSLQINDEYLSNKIIITEGNLTLAAKLIPGSYEFSVLATNAQTQNQARATVRISVFEKLCANELLKTVEKSLAIVHLTENGIYDNIMYSKIDDCEYEIIEVTPSVLSSIFTIDTSSHYLKNTQAFDRESSIFNDQITPQIQIAMELNCESSASRSSSSLMAPFIASNIVTDEIYFSTSITHLNIIITDDNDNYPVITNPPLSNFRIGFPEESLIDRLMPPHLIKIEAHDLDEGINAKIKFFLSQPTDHFSIDSEDGVIYPKQKLIDSTTTITARAVDLDGDENGKSVEVTLEVIKLTIDEIIQMTVNNLNIKNVDEFISNFANRVNLDLRIISHAPLPQDHVVNARQLNEFNDGKLMLYIYAFARNGDVVKAQSLIETLIAANESEIDFSLINNNDEDRNDPGKSNDGWMAAAIVLGSLVVLMIIIIIPLIYVYYEMRKHVPRRISEISQTSSTKDLNENFDAEPGQSTPMPNTEVESQTTNTGDAVGVEVNDEANVTQSQSLEGASSSDAERLNNRLLTLLDGDEVEDKKNVSFKKYVERIEVLDDSK